MSERGLSSDERHSKRQLRKLATTAVNLKLVYSAKTSPIVYHDALYSCGLVALSGRPNKSLKEEKFTWSHYFPAVRWNIFLMHDFMLTPPLTSSTSSFNSPRSLPPPVYFDSISSSFSTSSHAVFSSTHFYVAPSALRDSSPFPSYEHAPPSSTTPHNSCDAFETQSKSPRQRHPSFSPTDVTPSAATYNSNTSSSYLYIPSSTPPINGSVSLEQFDCKPAAFESWDCYSPSFVSDRISSARYYTTVATSEAYLDNSFSCETFQQCLTITQAMFYASSDPSIP